MIVRDHSLLIKIKNFGTTFLMALSALILLKLYWVNFDLDLLELSKTEISTLAMISAIPAYQMNKVRYVISRIDNTDHFIEWLYKYFEKFNGNVIHKTSYLIVFEVVEKSKRLFRKREISYYVVKIEGRKATVEGPFYKKPVATENEYTA